jgi:2-methylcitrate dehydratase PrpD
VAGLGVPHGHHDDPLTDAEVEQKFTALAGRKLTPVRLARAMGVIQDFEHCARIDDLFDALAIDGEA